MRPGALGPLDQADRVRAEVIAKACVLPFIGVSEAKKIKVVQVYARKRIKFNQRIGRALHLAAVAERRDDSARERRLACAQLAREVDDESRLERSREPRSEGEGGRFVGKVQRERC